MATIFHVKNLSSLPLAIFTIKRPMSGDLHIKNINTNEEVSITIRSNKKIDGFYIRYKKKMSVDPRFHVNFTVKPEDFHNFYVKVYDNDLKLIFLK